MPDGFLDEGNGATLFCDDCGQQVRTNEHHECNLGPRAAEMEQWLDDNPGMWVAHNDYPVADWQYAVNNDDTRLGYREWLVSEAEATDMEEHAADVDDSNHDAGASTPAGD